MYLDSEQEVTDMPKTSYPITPLYGELTGIKIAEKSIVFVKPDKIVKVSDNEVYAIYGNYKQTWKADGTGDERYNFTETIEEVVT